MSHKHVLNSERRRIRKEQLARRHGQHCAYCRRPFATLREATLDHIAPYSLWRTWTVTALALACLDCNNAKADRFPLSLAMVLLWSAAPSRPTPAPTVWPLLARLAHANRSAFTAMWATAESADPIGEQSTPDQRDDPRHTQRHTPASHPIARPDCLRAPRPVRVCAGPTPEAVFA